MLIGCRLGSEALFLLPEEWRNNWIQAGGRILREATLGETIVGLSEPVLLEAKVALAASLVPPPSVSLFTMGPSTASRPLQTLATGVTPPKRRR